MQQQTTVRFGKMEIVVQYDPKEPETYTVISAYHNGNDVTDFYQDTEVDSQGLYWPQINEAIAHEICSDRLERYKPAPFDLFAALGSALRA